MIFLINLDRRPDRLTAMETQFETLGVGWRRIAAIDAQVASDERLSADVALTGHRMAMGRGSMCCAATNCDIFRMILEENLPAAMIVQDDAELAADLPALMDDLSWIPDDIGIVQCELYRNRPVRRLTGPGCPTRTVGRSIHRLHARTVGAAAYIITKRAAAICVAARPIRMPIDHFLFNPNISPVFHQVGVGVVMPAVARQRAEAGSDMSDERTSQGKPRGWRARFGRLVYDLRPVPHQAAAIARGARFRSLTFQVDPAVSATLRPPPPSG